MFLGTSIDYKLFIYEFDLLVNKTRKYWQSNTEKSLAFRQTIIAHTNKNTNRPYLRLFDVVRM